jgi:hypothetical protein
MGRGLVEPLGDFGTQGSRPTHPELLDWLAVEFMESGWDIKHLTRLIVTSATFKQSSDLTQQALATDPENVWYERGTRARLPAEMIRDSALAASGLLVDEIGGPSVHPYQPASLWENSSAQIDYRYPDPDEVPADEHHRRSLYSSSSPLQALVLLNDPQYLEAYRRIAERAYLTENDADDRIVTIFRLGARRTPTDKEFEILREYYQDEYARYSGLEQDVERILSIGVSEPGPVADPVAVVALTSVAAAVMNTPDAYFIK